MNPIVTRTATTWLGADGIIMVEEGVGCELTLADAVENVDACVRAAAGTRCPLLVDMSEVRSISREAREHYTRDQIAQSVSAIALVVGNPLSRMIGNFFLGVNKPPVPTRVFRSRDAAAGWLRQVAASEVRR